MSLLPEVPNPYAAALSGGLLYGLVFCTSACLAFVAGYVAGNGAGFRKGITITLIFNSGRLAAYALIGGAIGAFKLVISGVFLSSFQTYLSFAFGIETTVIGPIGLRTALFGGAPGWLLNKAPLLRKWISRFGAGLLMGLRLAKLLNSIIVTHS